MQPTTGISFPFVPLCESSPSYALAVCVCVFVVLTKMHLHFAFAWRCRRHRCRRFHSSLLAAKKRGKKSVWLSGYVIESVDLVDIAVAP